MATLTINTEVPLTDREKAILRLLLDEPAKTPAPDKDSQTKAQKAPAKPAKEEPPFEPDEDSEDFVEKAIKVAKDLVRDGDAATVQKALEAAEAGRVSEMTPEQAGKFLEAVQ